MAYTVTGSPAEPFAGAVLDALLADASVTALVGTRIAAATKLNVRTPFPYIVGGRTDVEAGAVAMQKDGGASVVWLDVFSDKNGPHEVHQILSAIRAVLRRDVVLTMPDFLMYGGSLACDEEHVFSEADPDMPERGLFHGVQRWTADLEAA